jgi:predicted ArsR family transcriptional regulator
LSHKATNWAVSQRGLKPIAKVLLWHLADRHHPDNGCFPSQAALASDCEISRASVNRHLDDLEASGLIRREPRIDKTTGKQLPTRYVLAFEDDFGTPDVVGRVSESDTVPCLKNDGSRVSKSAETVSHSSETLTSKITSNLTGKASERVSNDVLWGAYPHRPMDNRGRFDAVMAEKSDAETVRMLVAVQRFAQFHIEDAEARGVTPDAQLEYRPAQARWVSTGAWLDALTVPLKSDPVPPSAHGLVSLAPDHPDYQAVEKMLGKKLMAFGGKRTFRVEEIEQARTAA